METTVKIRPEFLVRRPGCGRESAHDQGTPGREVDESGTAQVAETTLDTMTDDGVPDDTADDEAHAREPVWLTARLVNGVPLKIVCTFDTAPASSSNVALSIAWTHVSASTGRM